MGIYSKVKPKQAVKVITFQKHQIVQTLDGKSYFCRKCGVPSGKIPTANFIKLQLNGSYRHGKKRELNDWFFCPDVDSTTILSAPIPQHFKRPAYQRNLSANYTGSRPRHWWENTTVRGHRFIHNGIDRTARDCKDFSNDDNIPYLICRKCNIAVPWVRRLILGEGALASLEEGKFTCPGTPEQVNSLIDRMHGLIDKWKIQNPDNSHNIVCRDEELRWNCDRCHRIGGSYFRFEMPRGKAKTKKQAPTEHTVMDRLGSEELDWRFHASVNTACTHHREPERIT